MKKILVMCLITSLLGCSAIGKAARKVKNEVSGYKLAVANVADGFVYVEKGKFWYKKTIDSEPRQIELKDIGNYTLDTIVE